MLFWPFRQVSKLNTINLGEDLDDVEFIMAIEEIFGVKFSDNETIKLITMGDLERLVRAKLAAKSDADRVWTILCRAARDFTNYKGPIDRETTFFAKLAKERTETNG